MGVKRILEITLRKYVSPSKKGTDALNDFIKSMLNSQIGFILIKFLINKINKQSFPKYPIYLLEIWCYLPLEGGAGVPGDAATR